MGHETVWGETQPRIGIRHGCICPARQKSLFVKHRGEFENERDETKSIAQAEIVKVTRRTAEGADVDELVMVVLLVVILIALRGELRCAQPAPPTKSSR